MRRRARDWWARGAAMPAALFAVTSCVPVAPPARVVQAVPPVAARDRALLRGLGLDVPVAGGDAAAPRSASAVAPPFTATAQSEDDADRARACLADAVYYEARSEPLDGQRAVAQVVLNRVRDRAFPASVCGVVFQRSSRGCQFSFACDGSMLRPREPGAWGVAEEVARRALGGEVFAGVGSATHYHADSILPWWASRLVEVGALGHHIFYRWGSGLERALAFRQDYAGVEPEAGPAALPTVHTGQGYADVSEEGGVAVHRGLGDGASDAAQALAQPAPPRLVAGVRIHRGMTAPGFADDAEPEEDEPTS